MYKWHPEHSLLPCGDAASAVYMAKQLLRTMYWLHASLLSLLVKQWWCCSSSSTSEHCCGMSYLKVPALKETPWQSIPMVATMRC
jgi:hypothetical protein